MHKVLLANILNGLITFCTTTGFRLVGAVVLLFIGFKLVRMFTRFLLKSRAMSKMDGGVKTFTVNFINVGLKTLLLVTAASIVGLPTASVVTVIGSAGVAIGLALQGSLSNIAGGLILLMFKPFHVGDSITVEGESGTVEEIGVFYTKITTADNRMVIFPNSKVSNGKIVNGSAKETRRADFSFSVSYNADIDKVKALLYAAAKECTYILPDPAPSVFLSEQTGKALVFSVNVWCRCDEFLHVKSDLTERVKKTFDANNIQIP